MKNQDFSYVVKEVRRQLGMSQEELAHELGVSFATVNRWENKKTNPLKMAQIRFDAFCKEKVNAGEIILPSLNIGQAIGMVDD